MSTQSNLLAGLIALLLSGSAIAHPEDDRYDGYLGERFEIRLGTFLIDRFDTTARFDSRQFPIGTLIDLEDNFDVDSRERMARIDGHFRFNARHLLEWTYYRSRRDGEAVASQEFVIGDVDDPDGGFVIPKDATISTQWNVDVLKLGYAYSFVNKRRYEMFVGAGLNMRTMDLEVSYQANLAGDTAQDAFGARQLVPLPTAVIGGRWNFTQKWQGHFRYELFMLDIGDYRGSQQEVLLRFEHNTFKHVGLGFGFNLINVNLRAKSDEFRGEFDSRIQGFIGYIKFYL